jgi:hypothetical protein
MTALRLLLAGSIDYAGLFPPAALDMATAVSNYASYREGTTAWALGRFVVPVGRLQEFEATAMGVLATRPPRTRWKVSVLLAGDTEAEVRAIGDFNRRHATKGTELLADVVEAKGTTPEGIRDLLLTLPGYLQPYVEIPVNADPAPLIAAIAETRGGAKIRTGGVTPDAFPMAQDILRFISACLAAKVPFKATAGLHHPLRAVYPLTYEADSPRAPMFGFLNLFLATVSLVQGGDETAAARLLEETSPTSLQLNNGAIEWEGRRFGKSDIQRARETGIASFGSCSFTEPIGDLTAIHLL